MFHSAALRTAHRYHGPIALQVRARRKHTSRSRAAQPIVESVQLAVDVEHLINDTKLTEVPPCLEMAPAAQPAGLRDTPQLRNLLSAPPSPRASTSERGGSAPSLASSLPSAAVSKPEWTADDVEGLTCNVLTMLVSGDVEVFAPHNKFVETFRSQTDDDWPAPTHLRARHVVRAARAQAEGTCGVQFDPATLLWMWGPGAARLCDYVVAAVRALFLKGKPRADPDTDDDVIGLLELVLGETAQLYSEQFDGAPIDRLMLAGVMCHDNASEMVRRLLLPSWLHHAVLVAEHVSARCPKDDSSLVSRSLDVLKPIVLQLRQRRDAMLAANDHHGVVRDLLTERRVTSVLRPPVAHPLFRHVMKALQPPPGRGLKALEHNGMHQAIWWTLYRASLQEKTDRLERRLEKDRGLCATIALANIMARHRAATDIGERMLAEHWRGPVEELFTYFEDEAMQAKFDFQIALAKLGDQDDPRNWRNERALAHLVLDDVPTAQDVGACLEREGDTLHAVRYFHEQTALYNTLLADGLLQVLSVENVWCLHRNGTACLHSSFGRRDAVTDAVRLGDMWGPLRAVHEYVRDATAPLPPWMTQPETDISPLVALLRAQKGAHDVLHRLLARYNPTIGMELAERELVAAAVGWRYKSTNVVHKKPRARVDLLLEHGLQWMPVLARDVKARLQASRCPWATEDVDEKVVLAKALFCVVRGLMSAEGQQPKQEQLGRSWRATQIANDAAWQLGIADGDAVAARNHITSAEGRHAVGVFVAQMRRELLAAAITVWLHLPPVTTSCSAAAMAHRVVRIFKPDLPPLHKGMIPKTATSDPVAWGIVFLVDAFDGGFRRYVHKDDLLVVTHNNAWADYADAPESAKAWLPPNGAVHPQSHFSDKPVDWAPALLWWSTTRPLNDLGRAAVRDESLKVTAASLVMLLQSMFSPEKYLYLERHEPFPVVVLYAVSKDADARQQLPASTSWSHRPALKTVFLGRRALSSQRAEAARALPAADAPKLTEAERVSTAADVFKWATYRPQVLVRVLKLRVTEPDNSIFTSSTLLSAMLVTSSREPDKPKRLSFVALVLKATSMVAKIKEPVAFRAELATAVSRSCRDIDTMHPTQIPLRTRYHKQRLREACLDVLSHGEAFAEDGLVHRMRQRGRGCAQIWSAIDQFKLNDRVLRLLASDQDGSAARKLNDAVLRRVHALLPVLRPHLVQNVPKSVMALQARVLEGRFLASADTLAELLDRVLLIFLWACFTGRV